MINSIQFIGYHGTKGDYARRICLERCFNPSTSSSEWLGKGIYFFKEDKIQAYLFARYRHNEDVSVLSVDIGTDNYIDMSVTEDRNEVESYLSLLLNLYKNKASSDYKDLINRHPELQNGLTDTLIDGLILDLIYEIKPFDLVVCPFDVPGKKKNKWFRFKATQIQVCVKDNSCIDYDSLKEVDENEHKKILP